MDILDIAKRECKGEATQDEVAYLNKPEMLGQWVNALLIALNELDSQMTYHRDRVTMLADDVKMKLISTEQYRHEKEKFDSWQRKALRYKSGIQKRVSEVKMMMLNGDSEFNNSHVLVSAIMKHKQQTEASGLDPEPHDIELWSSLALI
jgi:hypothetical protein